MVRSFRFASSPEIHFGEGMLHMLPQLISRFGKHAFLLTGARSFRESPFFKGLTQALTKAEINFEIIGIAEEPSPMLIDGMASKFRRITPNVVVSIGGGSVIDAGKALSAMLPTMHSVYEYLEGVGTGKQHPGTKVPFIAVPTTAGTGSETTKNAVLSDVGKAGFKRSIRHNNFVPDIALVDPELTLSCPPNVTAACGLDALTQLIEAYVSLNASPLTDSIAISGLQEMNDALLRAYKNPSDLEARIRMSYASLMSGLALANAGLGVVHGFASVIGGYREIPHGVICGTLLAKSVHVNIRKLEELSPGSFALEKYANVARLLSPNNNNAVIDSPHSLAALLEDWTKQLRIPKLHEYGMKENDIERIIEETGIKQNPVELGRDELEEILRERF